MEKVAVVSVDLQRDFLDQTTSAGVASWSKAFCVKGVSALLRHAADKKWPVVHVGTLHHDRSTLTPFLARKNAPLFCHVGSPGAEFIVGPGAGEIAIFKTQYNGFTGTDLQVRLGGPCDVLIAGVATDCCILHTAYEADRLGYRAYVPLQAVSASTIHAFIGGLDSMAKSAATIVDLDLLLDGRTLEKSALTRADLTDRATAWFNERNALVDNLMPTATLRDVLALLDN